MARPSDRDQLLERLEAAATGPRRGSVVVYEVCVSDASGTRLVAGDPVLVPEGASRVAAGLRFTLSSLRRRPRSRAGSLPQTLLAIAHNLRGGRRLGTVVVYSRRPGASWSA